MPLLGSILLAIWSRDRRLLPLAVLAGAMFVQTPAALLFALRGEIENSWVVLGANALTLLALGLQWSAIRIAEGRRPRPWLLAPALAWLLACAVPAFYASYSARVVVASLLFAALDAANVAEFARRHAESVPSRRLAIVAYGFHCLLYAARAGMVLAADAGLHAAGPDQLSDWVNRALELCLYYTALLHPAVAALVLLAMAKERAEAGPGAGAARTPAAGAGAEPPGEEHPRHRPGHVAADRAAIRRRHGALPHRLPWPGCRRWPGRTTC